MGEYYWGSKDSMYFTTVLGEKKGETEVIMTPSGPERWNTNALCVASCSSSLVADRIAQLFAIHGFKGKS